MNAVSAVPKVPLNVTAGQAQSQLLKDRTRVLGAVQTLTVNCTDSVADTASVNVSFKMSSVVDNQNHFDQPSVGYMLHHADTEHLYNYKWNYNLKI